VVEAEGGGFALDERLHPWLDMRAVASRLEVHDLSAARVIGPRGPNDRHRTILLRGREAAKPS